MGILVVSDGILIQQQQEVVSEPRESEEMPAPHKHEGYGSGLHKLPAIAGLQSYRPVDKMEIWRHRCRQEPEAFGFRNCAEISMLYSTKPVPRGRTPVATRTVQRRPPTGSEFNVIGGASQTSLKESVKGLGSTLQRVSDDMVGRHVSDGEPSRALSRAQDSAASQWWESTFSRTIGSAVLDNVPTSVKPLMHRPVDAAHKEAIQERKVAEMYLQCNNHREAQKHLSQSARLFALADRATQRSLKA